MKKTIILLLLITIVILSCKEKKKSTPVITPPPPVVITDTVKVLHDVALEDIEKDIQISMMKRKRPVPPPPPPDIPPTDPVPIKEACILLDFDGHLVKQTMWNSNGDIVALSSGLTLLQQQEILDSVKNYCRVIPNLYITTDSVQYLKFASYKRMRVVVTTSWEWYGNVGGVSYINSFNWGTGEPCFVFSSLLGLSNTKMIADACAHEAGHTFGCRHQSNWKDGVKIGEYLWGDLIMGASYNSSKPIFGIGVNSLGVVQNDTLIINNTIRK